LVANDGHEALEVYKKNKEKIDLEEAIKIMEETEEVQISFDFIGNKKNPS